jgi:RimJ/RimL family protein N-acetyltransferase
MFHSARYPRPWRLSALLPPECIRTPRLALRSWQPEDAPLFLSAFTPSRAYVGLWVPPALDEPSEVDAIALRMERLRDEFRSGVGFVYAIFDNEGTEVLGEAGLMPRVGTGALEIGYWIRCERAGEGFATEATRALTSAGFALPEVDRIEIHCDSANAPSIAVPRKLGYRVARGRASGSPDSGTPSGDTVVFALSASDWKGPPEA